MHKATAEIHKSAQIGLSWSDGQRLKEQGVAVTDDSFKYLYDKVDGAYSK